MPELSLSYTSERFGFRIQLPSGFRRSDCLSYVLGVGDLLGVETFTLLSPDRERSEDLSHVATISTATRWTLRVTVRTTDMSSLDLAQRGGDPSGDVVAGPDRRTEALRLDGHEAARSLIRGEPVLYVVRGGSRAYVLELVFDPDAQRDRLSLLPEGVLEPIAQSLDIWAEAPIATPSPAPATAPQGAQAAATELAEAMEAADAIRVARSATPTCWMSVLADAAGPVERAVEPYISELQERFRAAGLRVRVDPNVQVSSSDGPGRLRLFVRSVWSQDGDVKLADMYLREVNGRWYWGGIWSH